MWDLKVQLLPRTNTLLGFSYDGGLLSDDKLPHQKPIKFHEISFGMILIVIHFTWT